MQGRPIRAFKQPTIYQAPKPKMTGSALAWMILLFRIFFPPILVWDIAKFVMNWLFGGLISRLVLQAQDCGYNHQYKNHIPSEVERINQEGNLAAERFSVLTHDAATLDTLEIRSKEEKTAPVPPHEQKYIIQLLGNAQCCEQAINDAEEDAKALNCNVVLFNHRGVSQSTSKPYSKNDLVTDGIAQVQRLLDKGISAENITLKGFSLGGAIGTLVTKHFHDHGIKINVFNDRSFSSITNFLVGHVRKADWTRLSGHQESFFKKILGWIVKPILMFALALTKWEIDAASAYKGIPDTHKEYMVVRSPKNERDAKVVDDGVVTHYASLHAALKDERRAYKKKIDYTLASLSSESTYAMVGNSLEVAREKLKEARLRIKERKMVPVSGRQWNSHCDDPDNLKSRYQGHTGKEFFRGFFDRAHKHHKQEREKSIASVTRSMNA
jgi:pimeloyl-ACP methyl ester carboxylesterase